ncbi:MULTISPECIES: hypothetical protein [Niastella]|nr:hypothetical protein [Niastella soli]
MYREAFLLKVSEEPNEGAMGTQRLFVDKPTAILKGYSGGINE